MIYKGKRIYNWLFIIGILLVLSILISVFFLNKENYAISENDIKDYNKGWEYKGEKIELPGRVDYKNGETIQISKYLPLSIVEDSNLFFLAENQKIVVYINDEPVYHYAEKGNYLYGDNLGMAYIKVPLLTKYSGQKIKIEFTPQSTEKPNLLPEIKWGNTSSIVLNIFKENFLGLFLSFLILIVSIFFFVQSLVVRKRSLNVDCLIYLSISGIIYSFWTGASTMIWQLFYGNTLFMYYLLCLSFVIMPMPVMLCIKTLFKNTNNRFLNVMIVLSFFNLVVCVILDALNIKKLNETFFSSHIIIVLTIFVLFYMLANHSFKKYKGIKYVFFFFLVTVLLDIGRYYLLTTEKTACFSRVGILVFLIFLGKQILYNLLFEIQTNKKYKEMAFRDVLTEAYSWVALTERVRAIKNIKKCAIAMFDLNDLKHYNDTYGHMAGDNLIAGSAKVINEAFSEWGGVYRIGGDEFLVLMYGGSRTAFNECIEKLKELVNEYNAYNYVRMQIAYGFAWYEVQEDNFETIKNRADIEMYNRKRIFKQERFIEKSEMLF